jgi:hypothetical protein
MAKNSDSCKDYPVAPQLPVTVPKVKKRFRRLPAKGSPEFQQYSLMTLYLKLRIPRHFHLSQALSLH